jgi:hypothetical protein
MTIGVWYWLIYVIALLFIGWRGYVESDRRFLVPSLIVWVLLGLIGYGLFGSPLE